MSSLLSTAETWLAAQLKSHESVTVSMRCGTQTISDLAATVDDHEYEVINGMGVPVQIVSRDYTFTTTDLVLNGSEVEPKSGYVVIENGTEYELMPLGSKPCFEKSAHGKLLTVHTKRVKIG